MTYPRPWLQTSRISDSLRGVEPMWKKTLMWLRRKGASARGFTLIEVLISMAITIIVMGAVFGLLTRGQQTFQREPQVADLQQSARTALDMVARDALQAGAGLPPEFPAFTTTTVDPAVGDQAPTDVIEIVGTLQTPGELPSDPEVVASFSPGTDEVTLDSTITSIVGDDLVVLYDNNPLNPEWIMARVVEPVAGNVITLDRSAVNANYSQVIDDTWPAGQTQIVRVNVVRYFTQLPPPDEAATFAVPPRVLMRQVDFGTAMPVGYLEDFQIAYMVGNINPAEQMNPPEPQPVMGNYIQDADMVSSVRITVTARSTLENLQGSSDGGAQGNFIRKTFSSSVNPRNISAGLADRSMQAGNPPVY